MSDTGSSGSGDFSDGEDWMPVVDRADQRVIKLDWQLLRAVVLHKSVAKVRAALAAGARKDQKWYLEFGDDEAVNLANAKTVQELAVQQAMPAIVAELKK
eukprot:c31254_g1_i1.p1 GENE.c31254_g1_i1~~c31254_g1_i1.p1  ORF type:complete len:113 (+),score=26.45 c31254_g1_i1:41-340(+)